MNWKTSLPHSLKTRITLLTLVIFLASLWSLVLYAEKILRVHVQDMLAGQQMAIASVLAADVAHEVQQRFRALELVAGELGELRDTRAVARQEALDGFLVFQSLFNGGSFITDTTGLAVASHPAGVERVGVDYSDRDYIRAALDSGMPAISKPVQGRTLKAPIIAVSTPIRGPGGSIAGALAGIINLAEPNFLDRISERHTATSGTYLLVDKLHRLIISGTDRARVMELLPARGTSPVLDRFLDGAEGSAIFVNPLGIEVLSSVKQIAGTNWYAAALMPTATAFAPVARILQHIFVAALLLTLFACALTWWMLRHFLAPLQSTAQALAEFASGDRPLRPLRDGRKDEIGQVVSGFNRLLTELSTRQESLRQSEQLYRTAFQTSPDAVTITRIADGHFVEVNAGFTNLYGWQRDEAVGKTAQELGIWRDWERRRGLVSALRERGECRNIETEYQARDGRQIFALVSATRILMNGEPCMLAVTRDITELKAAMEQVQRLAFSDPLTGLANRRLFLDRLRQAVAGCSLHPHHGALVYIDLDDFKTLNDILGHDYGDILLKQVAAWLTTCVGKGDTVARLGGDEFVVLLDYLSADAAEAAGQAEAVAEKILTMIRQPVRFDSFEHIGSASIGIALFGAAHDATVDHLQRADQAMYQAKAAGRSTIRFFDPQVQGMINARVALTAHLRDALLQQAFELHYQLQVADEDNRVIGVEALLRWCDPAQAPAPLHEVIALAEETGLILPLGKWVLETACAQLAAWAQHARTAQLTIAVNVSARQFLQNDFTEQVRSTLALSGAPAARLVLELTESMLVTNTEGVIAKMHELKALGVGFSLDDFGTGFSSLSYLKRLPLDQLKIDQSFVRDITADANSAAIAEMVIALGHSLGLAVLAEGVETTAQHAMLARLGCRKYQGYLFGRPATIDAVEQALVPARP